MQGGKPMQARCWIYLLIYTPRYSLQSTDFNGCLPGDWADGNVLMSA